MRIPMLAALILAAIAAPAHAADFGLPAYGAAPPPPPPAYGPPPPYGYAPPPAYGPPVAMAPQAYVEPGAAYDDQAIIIDGERYYRDCWWDWGRRRCELKRWW